MKILMISSYLPYPLHSGGQVRLYNLIKELSSKHEITLICEKRSHQTAQDIAEVKKICNEVITVNRKKQWSVSNILKAGVSSHSFLVTGHTQDIFKQKIQQRLAKEKFDLIHVETYYVMQNLLNVIARSGPTKQSNVQEFASPSSMVRNDGQEIPVVLVEHNIEYSVYEKFRDRAPAFLRPLLALDIAKIRKEEEGYWKGANALVAVSHEDKNLMKNAGFDPFFVPNGVNTDQFKFRSFDERSHFAKASRDKKILYLGDFKWIQNKDAVTFIIKEIWPEISTKFKVQNSKSILKLWIVGRNIPDSIRRLTSDPDVLFDQESSSLPTEEIFQQAAVLLAPIRVGGGTSYKILESMSSGTPVVTMQMSATALGAKDGHDVMVGQTAEELAKKSLELLKDADLYKKIAKNGRELVEKNYTWHEIGITLEGVYNAAVVTYERP